MAWFRCGFSAETFPLSALWVWALLVGLARRSYLSPFYSHWFGDFGTRGDVSVGPEIEGGVVTYLGFGGRGALLDALRQGVTGHFATNGTLRN